MKRSTALQSNNSINTAAVYRQHTNIINNHNNHNHSNSIQQHHQQINNNNNLHHHHNHHMHHINHSQEDPNTQEPTNDFLFYPSAAIHLDQRYRPFAGGSPANIGYGPMPHNHHNHHNHQQHHQHHHHHHHQQQQQQQHTFGDSVPVAEDGAVVDATSFAISPSLKTNSKKYPHERTRRQSKPASPQEAIENYDDMFAAQAK
ncbi:hypothetical protein F4703DRAFT_1889079 [Phycomyces blakesleeanus]